MIPLPSLTLKCHSSKEIDTELAHCLGVVTPRLSLEEFKVFAHPLVERIASAAYHTDCDWLQAVLCHILARSLQLRLVGAGSLTALLPPYPNAVTRASIVLCFMRAIVALDEPAPSAPMLSLSLQGPTSPRQLHGQVIELEAAPAHGSRASGPKGAEFLAALAYSARELMPPPDLHVKTTVSHSLQRLWMIALLCLKFGGNVDHVFSVATAWLRCSAAWVCCARRRDTRVTLQLTTDRYVHMDAAGFLTARRCGPLQRSQQGALRAAGRRVDHDRRASRVHVERALQPAR